MEDSLGTLRQLKQIKWLLALITAVALAAAGSVAYVAFKAFAMAESGLADVSCEADTFREKVSSLVDKNKLGEAVAFANQRAKEFPNDVDAYWYRGLAYYLDGKWQLAIEDFNKVEVLAPSWRDQYVEPYRAAAQARLGKP